MLEFIVETITIKSLLVLGERHSSLLVGAGGFEIALAQLFPRVWPRRLRDNHRLPGSSTSSKPHTNSVIMRI